MFPQHPISPVVEGLTSAFQLANMIHGQRAQDAQLALEKQRMADQQQMEQSREERQNADLSMRLNAMGARQATPSDDLEAQTGIATRFNAVRGQTPDTSEADGIGGLPQGQTRVLPSFEPSDIKSRLVKAGGQKWVMPTQDEQDARTTRANKLDSDAAVAKATAVEEARGKVKMGEDKSRLDTLGIPLQDEYAQLLGLPKGTKIMPEHLDDYARSVASMKAAKLQETNSVVHAIPMYGEKGTGVAVVKKDGTVSWNPIDIGDKFSKPTKTSPNEQRLADKAATDNLVEEAASRYAQKYPKFEDADAALKADAAKDPFVGKQYLRIRKALPGASTADKPKTLNNMVMIGPDGKITAEAKELMNGTAAPDKTPAPAPAKTAAPVAKRPRALNKKTGQWMEYDGTAWVKAAS